MTFLVINFASLLLPLSRLVAEASRSSAEWHAHLSLSSRHVASDSFRSSPGTLAVAVRLETHHIDASHRRLSFG
jgi:hypothetical protein